MGLIIARGGGEAVPREGATRGIEKDLERVRLGDDEDLQVSADPWEAVRDPAIAGPSAKRTSGFLALANAISKLISLGRDAAIVGVLGFSAAADKLTILLAAS